MLAIGLAAAAAIGIVLVFVGISRLMAPDVDVNARLDQLATSPAAVRTASTTSRVSGRMVAGLDKAVAGRGFATQLAQDLARADIKLTVSEYIAVNILVVIGVAALAYFSTRSIPAGAVFGLSSLFLPRLYVGMRQRNRLNSFNNQLSDTCEMLSNSLRSGYSLLQSMEMVAREGPSPTSDEFQRVVREVGLGLSAEEALANLVRRIASEDLDLVVTAINVQHEVGGNLAQILDSISHTIRERVRVKGEIKTLTSQVSCSGNVVSLLPVALCVVLYIINPEYMSQLFEPGLTLCLPAGAVGGILLGWLAMRKITQIEV
ncbi:MAG: type II secretion system F family protein [Dehalococcoidales bacterium]|nr:type II secretion system F family protein [Dehalococcoidales bacterium]